MIKAIYDASLAALLSVACWSADRVSDGVRGLNRILADRDADPTAREEGGEAAAQKDQKAA